MDYSQLATIGHLMKQTLIALTFFLVGITQAQEQHLISIDANGFLKIELPDPPSAFDVIIEPGDSIQNAIDQGHKNIWVKAGTHLGFDNQLSNHVTVYFANGVVITSDMTFGPNAGSSTIKCFGDTRIRGVTFQGTCQLLSVSGYLEFTRLNFDGDGGGLFCSHTAGTGVQPGNSTKINITGVNYTVNIGDANSAIDGGSQTALKISSPDPSSIRIIGGHYKSTAAVVVDNLEGVIYRDIKTTPSTELGGDMPTVVQVFKHSSTTPSIANAASHDVTHSEVVDPNGFRQVSVYTSDDIGSDVKALLNFNGADESTTMTNEVSGLTFTANGDAQIDTGSPIIGSSSLLLDGTGDYVESGTGSDLDIDGDFSIDFFFNADTVPNPGNAVLAYIGDPVDYVTIADADVYIDIKNGNIRGTVYTGGSSYSITGSTSISTGTDYHLCFRRIGSTLELFLDGTSEGTTTQAAALNYSSDHTLNIGRWVNIGDYRYFDGHIDLFRFSNGSSVYTGASFTPPTADISGNLKKVSDDDLAIEHTASNTTKITNNSGAQLDNVSFKIIGFGQ